MQWIRSLAVGSAWVVFAFAAAGQTLVADLNLTPPTANLGSGPSGIWSLGSVAIVAADDQRHGVEPWRSDGTVAGTRLLADLVPGSSSSMLVVPGSTDPVVLSGALYFTAYVASGGTALWRTDGTSAGTTVLATFGAFPSASPFFLTVAGGAVYFTADDGTHGRELWRTDGTPAGTAMVQDLVPGAAGSTPRNLVALGSDVLFVVTPAADTQLWRSDGTAANTTLVHDFGAVPRPFLDVGRFAALGGKLGFVGWDSVHGGEPWTTDGTAAGTALLKDVQPGATSSTVYVVAELVATGSAFFFPANDGTTGTELWTSDGTPSGTVLVADTNPSGSSAPTGLRPFGNAVLYTGSDGVHGSEPWISDGTAAGTRLLRDISPGTGSSSPQSITVLGALAIFTAVDGGHGREPWSTDGTTAGTVLLRDVMPGATGSTPATFAVHAGQVWFAADDGVVGQELWRTDGTANGTAMLVDLAVPKATGSSIAKMRAFGDRLVFTADDGMHGVEPWISDGTAAGTKLIADLAPGAAGSAPTFVEPYQDGLLLGAWVPGQGWALLRSDGTPAGTTVITVVRPASTPSPVPMFVPLGRLGDRVVLALDDGVHGVEPWISDGTAAGTAMIADVVPGSASSMANGGAVMGGELYFFATRTALGARGLWKTDGTAAGTVPLVEPPAPTFPANLEMVATPTGVFFTFQDGVHGVELWHTRGTPATTALVLDVRPGADASSPAELIEIDGVVRFSADDGVHGRELWRSDGTAAGTWLVADIHPSAGSSPRQLARAGNLTFFAADDGSAGTELWRSDGTAAGTVLVRDMYPGARSSTPTAIRAAGSGTNVVFQALDPVGGKEAWCSDGTAAGTMRLTDVEAGALDASPNAFLRVGTRIFFLASTWAMGEELYVMPLALTGAPLVETYGRGCAGSNGLVPAIGNPSLPTLGNAAFGFGLANALPVVPAALHLSPFGGVIALPPCTVYLLSPYTFAHTVTDALGTATFVTPIPPDPAALGLEVYAQWTVLDPVGGRGVTLSDAQRLLIGR